MTVDHRAGAKPPLVKSKLLAAGLIGITTGFISAHFLFHGSALNMLPWAILAVLIGLSASNKRTSRYSGAIYGYILSFSFLWFDKTTRTSRNQLLQLLVVIGLISFIGALSGMTLSSVGQRIMAKLHTKLTKR